MSTVGPSAFPILWPVLHNAQHRTKAESIPPQDPLIPPPAQPRTSYSHRLLFLHVLLLFLLLLIFSFLLNLRQLPRSGPEARDDPSRASPVPSPHLCCVFWDFPQSHLRFLASSPTLSLATTCLHCSDGDLKTALSFSEPQFPLMYFSAMNAGQELELLIITAPSFSNASLT